MDRPFHVSLDQANTDRVAWQDKKISGCAMSQGPHRTPLVSSFPPATAVFSGDGDSHELPRG